MSSKRSICFDVFDPDGLSPCNTRAADLRRSVYELILTYVGLFDQVINGEVPIEGSASSQVPCRLAGLCDLCDMIYAIHVKTARHISDVVTCFGGNKGHLLVSRGKTPIRKVPFTEDNALPASTLEQFGLSSSDLHTNPVDANHRSAVFDWDAASTCRQLAARPLFTPISPPPPVVSPPFVDDESHVFGSAGPFLRDGEPAYRADSPTGPIRPATPQEEDVESAPKAKKKREVSNHVHMVDTLSGSDSE